MRIRRNNSRRGITLLFVVSMILLFLLMGTAFVVVANDYFRSANKRNKAKLFSIDHSAYVERTMYDLIRGPELSNKLSPFRTHDLLSDQYGYGFRGVIGSGVVQIGTGDQFVQLTFGDLDGLPTATPPGPSGDEVYQLVNPVDGDGDGMLDPTTLDPISGLYNGLVLTVISGPARGMSTRIIDHVHNPGEPTGGNDTFSVSMQWLRGNAVTPAALVGAQVIVNNRDFSGTGAGGYTAPTGPDVATLSDEALNPNRVGESLADLQTNYLGAAQTSSATNEDYDAADFQNMMLSGRDRDGNIIPSYHRKSLYDYQFAQLSAVNRTPVNLKRFTFRPIFMDEVNNGDGTPVPDGIPDFGSTANANFPYNQNLLNSAAVTAANDLEVDTDLNGFNDSVFIDPGYGIITDRNGTRFKPLVAIQIVDLDGRLNLNAHGNLTQVQSANNFIATSPTMLGAGPNTLPRGDGYGPADVSLTELFTAPQYASLLSTRYSAKAGVIGNDVPGDGGISGYSGAHLIGHPQDTVDWNNGRFGTVGRLFANSPMNLQGRFAIGTPQGAFVNGASTFDNFQDPNYPTFPNGMPVIDMLASTNTTINEFAQNPYEVTFAPSPYGDVTDALFTPADLERVLRQYDVDSNLLSPRLWDAPGANYWQTNPDFRESVTTESYEVPMTPENFKALLIAKIADEAGVSQAVAATRADSLITNDDAIAPELLLGLKFDVNRVFGNGVDNADADLVVDNPSEANTETDVDGYGGVMDLDNDGTAGINEDPRLRFARHLYMLALVTTDEVPIDETGDGNPNPGAYQRLIAQWAVNVVDFRDPDSIMTRFLFDPDPWDGTWDTNAANPDQVRWGCESPSLLITETVGVHARRAEDLTTDTTGLDVAGGDPHFDSRLRPEPFAYFELYNPDTRNSFNRTFDPALYDANQNLDLARRSFESSSGAGDSSPVWRISIDRPFRPDPPQAAAEQGPVRFVYFTNPDDTTDTVGDDDAPNVEVFYSSFNNSLLKPGAQALVGTLGIENPSDADQFRVYMGRRTGKTAGDEAANNLELDITNHIAINPADNEVTTFPVDTTNDPRFSLVVPIDMARVGSAPGAARKFSVSDPFRGYPQIDSSGLPALAIPDGFSYTIPFDEPLDHPNDTDANRNEEDLLAIMADEGIADNLGFAGSENLPFREIRLQRLANPLLPWNLDTNPYLTVDSMELDLVAFNGATTDTEPNVIPTVVEASTSLERGARQIGVNEDRRQLWTAEWNNSRVPVPADTVGGAGDHLFDFVFNESLGKTNDSYTDALAVGEGKGFPWLKWNDRPFVSHTELANVPYTAPGQLTPSFSILDSSLAVFDGEDNRVRGRFAHLLNFFANETDAGVDRANLYKMMDYLEVPSRFLGAEQQLDPTVFLSPFDTVSRFRVPGKINLNTIYPDIGNADNSRIWLGLQGGNTGTSWVNFRDSRNAPAAAAGTFPTDFLRPYRSADNGNNVPNLGGGVSLVNAGPDSTLFREQTGAAGVPLFDFTSTDPTNDSERSAYFRNHQRQRLANLTTNRSSVFAIWVTVAYFEVDANGLLGAEIGSDTGDVKRNRGFCIFDRSVPMAFEPGKNHNVERGILVKSIIE